MKIKVLALIAVLSFATALLPGSQRVVAADHTFAEQISRSCSKFVGDPNIIGDPGIRPVAGLVDWCRNFIGDPNLIGDPGLVVAACRNFIGDPNTIGDPNQIGDPNLRRVVEHVVDQITHWCTKAIGNPDA